MQSIERLKSHSFLRTYSFLTCLVLCLSILFSILGSIGIILFQGMASITIVPATILEILHILMVISLTDRRDTIGWILHRFAYVTLLVTINSFLLIVGGTFLSTFSISGEGIMIIAVIGYIMQASFGVCLSAVTFHLLQIGNIWLGTDSFGHE